MPTAAVAFNAAFAHLEGAGETMLSTMKDLVLSEDDWILLDAA